MSQKVYECLFLLDSNRYARDPGSVSTGLNETIEKLDGEVLATRLWNEQKLAYPVRGHRKGTYWIIYFRIDGNRLPDFERACRLNDNILRNLTLAVDPRLVDVLVSHVLGEATEADVEEVASTIADGDEKAATEETAAEGAEKPAEEEAVAAEKPAEEEAVVAEEPAEEEAVVAEEPAEEKAVVAEEPAEEKAVVAEEASGEEE